MSLNELQVGKSGIITHMEGNNALTKRLSALGCIGGTTVFLKSIAPLGDPIVIDLMGSKIAIRKNDAKAIIIKEA